MEIQTPKDIKKLNKEGLTPKQKILYDVIKDFIKFNEYSPSYEELKQLMGSRSKSHIHALIHQLVRRHWIGKRNGANRSLFIL
jgi:SOS-response transcriptional repressor LexA